MTQLLLLLVINGVLITAHSENSYRNISTGQDFLDEDWQNDPYVEEANRQCSTGELFGCVKSGAVGTLSGLFTRRIYDVSEEAKFIRTNAVFQGPVVMEGLDFSEVPRGHSSYIEEALGFLSRRAENFLKTTAFEVKLSPELTGNGMYAPRFLDEIYSEIDTLEDKNDKPNKRYEFKKLFIPLLFILKLFKVKLLVLLPIIFGLVSFKKFLGFLAIIVPGIIGYYKVCKPDLGQSYGSYGHSSFYNRPPSKRHETYEYSDEEAMKLAYHGQVQ